MSKNKESRRARGEEEEREDNTKVQYVLWSCSDKRLRTPSFLITLRIAAFRSCLTVASYTNIPARITRDPATKVIESSLDKEQALNQTRTGGSSDLPSRSCDNLALESYGRDASSVAT
jgi:hypothetical protein